MKIEGLQPGQHYRHVNSGNVVMPVGIATEEVTFRKLVVYTERGLFGDRVWAVPLEIFEHRYDLVEEGKELRPVVSFPEFKPVINPDELLSENKHLKRCIEYLKRKIEDMEDRT